MKFYAKQTFCFVISVLFLCVVADLQAPVVHTKLGSLRGEYVSVKGKATGVHAYLGVPFAKPPLGPSLRLAPPQPVERWEGVRDATKQPPMCIQSKQLVFYLLDKLDGLLADVPDISEDCLYLNIYTPANRTNDTKIPVMVWIHGGGFTMGSASGYDGSALAAYQDVVVVLIQYRLGLLGFLSLSTGQIASFSPHHETPMASPAVAPYIGYIRGIATTAPFYSCCEEKTPIKLRHDGPEGRVWYHSTGDEHISGNFGLLDQVEALKWIQQHIHNFGGDPGLVTIFGESAGGVSVSLLLLSPLSDGLFHRAIAESGTAAMNVLVANNPLPMAQAVANESGCSLESTKKISDCMRNLDIDTIVGFTQDPTLRIQVNVDGRFLTKPVDELYRKHELHAVPFMTGVNNDEGGWILVSVFAPQNWTEGLDREVVVNTVALLYPDPKAAIVRDVIADEYIGNGDDRVKNRDGYTEMLGDLFFTIPAIKAANAHRDAGAPVYLYEYQHPPKFLQQKRPSFVGTDHGDEMFTVFGLCFTTTHVKLANPCPEDEEQLSKIMMSYWGNFARTGSPDGHNLVHWPKYEADEKYLAIGLQEQVTAQHLKKERFVFLTQIVPEKMRQHEKNAERRELMAHLFSLLYSLKYNQTKP